LYVDIELPEVMVDFLQLFSIFDLDFLPKFKDESEVKS